MNRCLAFFFIIFLTLNISAQRRLVVCDVETLDPIRDVSVRSSAGLDVTDSLGYFSVVDSCQSLLFSHINYESRLINLSEVRDTVFLLSKSMGMQEVVVFGMRKDRSVAENMNNMVKLNKTDAQLLAIDPANGGNLLGLLGKLLPKGKSKKRKEKVREILENY